MSIFDELQTSLQEAIKIKQGKLQPSRITVMQRLRSKPLAPS